MKSIEERFWTKVDVKDPDECWLWQDKPSPKWGYGVIWINDINKHIKAHRISYCLHNNYDLNHIKDLVIRHNCDNPICVNPHHLQSGTHADNVRDRNKRNRTAKGNELPTAKLNPTQVKYIRNNKHLGENKLSKLFGVSTTAIWQVTSGKTWKHIK